MQFLRISILFVLFLQSAECLGQRAIPFDLAVSPSRHMIGAAAGDSIARFVNLNNVGASQSDFVVRTLDWDMSPSGTAIYQDTLRVGSCRPWVAIERRQVSVDAGQTRVYRFQIDIPKGTPRGECRFMITFEGAAPAAQTVTKSAAGELRAPVMARIAIPVYIAIGGAAPKLEMVGTATATINGTRTPVVRVANRGDAHGRLEGGVDGVDGDGQDVVLVPEESPILPGQTREIPLTLRSARGQRAPAVKLPIKASGSLDWDGGTLKLDARFD